jgi:polyhydroxybutyrate depolymerase
MAKRLFHGCALALTNVVAATAYAQLAAAAQRKTRMVRAPAIKLPERVHLKRGHRKVARLIVVATGALIHISAISFAQQPILRFSPTSYGVAESAGGVSLTVQRLGDTNGTVSVDFSTKDGTAASGSRYAATNGTLEFGTGVRTQRVVVPILDDGLVQGSQRFGVVLSNPRGGAILASGVFTNATVTVEDNDVGVQFQQATYSVIEGEGVVQVAIARGDDGTAPASIEVATSDGTAVSGIDYLGVTTNIAFGASERLTWVSIPILNNALKQPNRSFNMILSHPVGLSLGVQATTTVTIIDDDQGFGFATNNTIASEDVGSVLVTVLRGTDETNSIVAVDVFTTDATATNGIDYLGLTNTLTFAPGERIRQIAVPILNNALKQPSRAFRLALSNPGGGATLSSQAAMAVTILDNDPGVGFERGSYSVSENAESVTLTVLRGNDVALGPFQVDYTTANLTAVAGTDYGATSGTLSFGANETVQTFTVPVFRNTNINSDTRFRVSLSNPTGGAVLGASFTTVSNFNVTGLGRFDVVAPPTNDELHISHNGDVNLVGWRGGGSLQRADRPLGPWQTIMSATDPYSVAPAVPESFYRVARPRPVNVYIPASYDGTTNVPLVILLHGYGSTGVTKEQYVKIQPIADTRGFIYCYPESFADPSGIEFWNATDFCCDFFGAGTDDADYLRRLILEIEHRFSVDPKRVYLVGHSNGGAMAHRMALQSGDLIAAIASLAGPCPWLDGTSPGSALVNVLQIHGTLDENFFYPGGAWTDMTTGLTRNLPSFPGALQVVELWAMHNGADDPVTETAPSMDLDSSLPGLDTVVTRYPDAPPGGAVELWTIVGGYHTPTLRPNGSSTEFAVRVVDWLLAHPKP